jgi:hypothetical protein
LGRLTYCLPFPVPGKRSPDRVIVMGNRGRPRESTGGGLVSRGLIPCLCVLMPRSLIVNDIGTRQCEQGAIFAIIGCNHALTRMALT